MDNGPSLHRSSHTTIEDVIAALRGMRVHRCNFRHEHAWSSPLKFCGQANMENRIGCGHSSSRHLTTAIHTLALLNVINRDQVRRLNLLCSEHQDALFEGDSVAVHLASMVQPSSPCREIAPLPHHQRILSQLGIDSSQTVRPEQLERELAKIQAVPTARLLAMRNFLLMVFEELHREPVDERCRSSVKGKVDAFLAKEASTLQRNTGKAAACEAMRSASFPSFYSAHSSDDTLPGRK